MPLKNKIVSFIKDESDITEVENKYNEIEVFVKEDLDLQKNEYFDEEIKIQLKSENNKEEGDTPYFSSLNTDLPVQDFLGEVTFHLDSSSSYEEKEQDQEPRAKKRATNMYLEEKEEAALIEWYEENECLYNKKLKRYKDIAYKNRIMEDKAKSMGFTSLQLITFFKSMRTRYVKLRKELTKLGRNRVDFTERDQCIFDRFSFLDAHVTKSKVRKPAKFPSVVRKPPSSTIHGFSGTLADNPDEDSVTPPEMRKSFSAPARSSSVDMQALALKLVDQATALGEARQVVTEPNTQKEKEVHHLVAFLQTQMVKIPDDNWWDFTIEAMQLVRRFQQPRQQMYYMQQQPQHSFATPPTPSPASVTPTSAPHHLDPPSPGPSPTVSRAVAGTSKQATLDSTCNESVFK